MNYDIECKEYKQCMDFFIAYLHLKYGIHMMLRCPCRKCLNENSLHTCLFHVLRKCSENKEEHKREENFMGHPADGLSWVNFDSEFPEFTKDCRNMRLGLASDGFNLFGNIQ